MKKSIILAAFLARPMITGMGSVTYAGDMTFSLVPADPPLNGKVNCTMVGLKKNQGLSLTFLKWVNEDASLNIHDQATFFGFANAGDFHKVIAAPACNISP